jgi:hypothetical protein
MLESFEAHALGMYTFKGLSTFYYRVQCGSWLELLHIVKDIVVVKLFPSINPSRHASSQSEGIM